MLANYKSGNKSYDLHFEYTIPLPNNHVALHPIIFFDIAGIITFNTILIIIIIIIIIIITIFLIRYSITI